MIRGMINMNGAYDHPVFVALALALALALDFATSDVFVQRRRLLLFVFFFSVLLFVCLLLLMSVRYSAHGSTVRQQP